MTASLPRDVTTWSVAEDGAKHPFAWSGLRIPLDARVWVQLDFDVVRRPVSVRVGVRARRDELRSLPSLTIRPRAGNSLVMLVGGGTQRPDGRLQIIPVNEFQLKGQDFWTVLAKYTSGDFAGEEALARFNPDEIAHRSFVIQYADLGWINVKVDRKEDSMLCVALQVDHERVASPGESHEALSLWLTLNASNLVSCHFEPATFVRATEPPPATRS
jgi:hypothetical protein